MNYESREWSPHQDRGPLYVVRSDGLHERLTRRHQVSGAAVWPIVLMLLAGTLVVGIQIGKRSPTLPPAPVSDYRPQVRGW